MLHCINYIGHLFQPNKQNQHKDFKFKDFIDSVMFSLYPTYSEFVEFYLLFFPLLFVPLSRSKSNCLAGLVDFTCLPLLCYLMSVIVLSSQDHALPDDGETKSGSQ